VAFCQYFFFNIHKFIFTKNKKERKKYGLDEKGESQKKLMKKKILYGVTFGKIEGERYLEGEKHTGCILYAY
jgi:hypothetical protein